MRHITSCILSVLLGILVLFPPVFSHSTPASSADEFQYTNWPLIRMDAQNTGFTTASLPTTMEYAGILPIHSHHAPIVGNNCYYLIEWKTGILHCYAAHTQKLVWKKQYSSMKSSQAEDMRYGNVCAFSEATNQLLLLETAEGDWWRKENFVSRVYALHPQNGDIQWQADIEGYYANSITLSATQAFVKVIDIQRTETSNYMSQKHKILSYDLRTGQKQWESNDIPGGEAYWYSNPPVYNSRYLVTSSSDGIYQEPNGDIISPSPCFISLLVKQGESYITYTYQMEQFSAISQPLLVDEKIYVIAGRAGSLALYFFHFEIIDSRLELLTHFCLANTPRYCYYSANLSRNNNFLYFLDISGLLACISITNTDILWQKQVGESCIGSHFCNEEYLVVCTQRDSHLTLQYFDPMNGTELFSTSVPYEGDIPIELTCTDNHIWVVCGGRYGYQIVHFTPPPPPSPPSITVTPLEIQNTCWVGTTDPFHHTLSVTTQGNIEGTIQCEESWVQLDTHRVHEHLTSVHVEVHPLEQSVGVHRATIAFDTNAGQIEVQVRLIVLLPPQLSIIPNEVTSTIVEGSSPPPYSLSCREYRRTWFGRILVMPRIVDPALRTCD